MNQMLFIEDDVLNGPRQTTRRDDLCGEARGAEKIRTEREREEGYKSVEGDLYLV